MKRSIIKSTLCSLNAKCIFYLPRRFLWSFDRWYSSNSCFCIALENFLKLENSPLKISPSLSNPSRTSYVHTVTRNPFLFPRKPPSRRTKTRNLTARAIEGFETTCIKFNKSIAEARRLNQSFKLWIQVDSWGKSSTCVSIWPDI